MCCQSNSRRSDIICWHVLHVTVTSLCALPQTRPHDINKQSDATLFYTHTTHLHTTWDEWSSWCHQSTVHPGPNGKMLGCYLEVPCKCRGLLCTRLFLKAPQYTDIHILIYSPRLYRPLENSIFSPLITAKMLSFILFQKIMLCSTFDKVTMRRSKRLEPTPNWGCCR